MVDDKTKKGKRDRDRVAAGEEYEVRYLMKKTGITESQALALIHRFGNDRQTLEREARKLTG
ncbi:DUF3606 domain-containing protein [Mesorhizobium sp. BAC0120]|uniref:DUF3606 domain-containing protein n=1 Tax=Mesorhizobium sp. BAC0120 TaxID=3090670 RepID=UPI00298D56A1|nr:DUF3606 domain-containing protein [Mesorhizobium sp. BAC0120]MDW6023159.1 DUF3606 domain-containing protein [Mesorhizobium sp. BAC0120]